MKFLLYTDGGSRGNPGDSAYAYIICDQPVQIAAGKNMMYEVDLMGQWINIESCQCTSVLIP